MRTPDLTTTPVTAVMSEQLVEVAAQCSIIDALDTLLGTGLRHLVVVGPTGRCRGLASSELVASRVLGRATGGGGSIGSLVPPSFTAVTPQATIADAASVMLSNLVDAVCVVDAELKAVGIVTWSDLLGLVAVDVRRPRDHVRV